MAKDKHLLKSRQAIAIVGAVSLVAAWFMFIRAVDTGSLQQYTLTIIFIAYGINRLFRAVVSK